MPALPRMLKLSTAAEWAVRVCAVVLGALFLLSGLVYLYLGRWTVTLQDYWRIYDLCFKHTWLESALLKYNSHSLFFPSFVWLADLRFFRGDQQLLFFAGLTLLFITVSLLLVPVWRDKTVGLTAKIVSTVVVIVGSFWMTRSEIIASGGFNCINSLTIGGAALAFIYLPTMCDNSRQSLSAMLVVVGAGLVASFSFGTGLAIWPTLLFLAWCLRSARRPVSALAFDALMWCLRPPRRAISVLVVATLAVVIIFEMLPSPGLPATELHPSFVTIGLRDLCRMLGAPIFYATYCWYKPTAIFAIQAAQSSFLAFSCGTVGLAIALITIAFTMVRRDFTKSSLELIGTALMIFNLIAMAIVVMGRARHFRALPFEVVAPRYLFWSTLFWTGLLLVAIQRAESKPRLRWPVYLIVLAVPVLAFPTHCYAGMTCRWARQMMEFGATCLVNGVRDDHQINVLFPDAPKQVYRVAEQLRVRRLDMFADGLQDWIGRDEANLFAGRHKPEGLNGQCRVRALLQCDNGAPAARVVGEASQYGHSIPKTLVVVDPNGIIRGVARSLPLSPFLNRLFYLGKFPADRFLGYIRDYNPQLHYAIRSVDEGVLSEEQIPVQAETINPAGP
jgi:hypothetical protein